MHPQGKRSDTAIPLAALAVLILLPIVEAKSEIFDLATA
jgi:hypothetical protein